MNRSKAGEDGISIHLLKDAANFLLDKLAVLCTKCLQTCSVPRDQKNATIILIYKKGNIKDKKITANKFTLLYTSFLQKLSQIGLVQCLTQISQKNKQNAAVVIQQLTTSMLLIKQWKKYAEYTKPLCIVFIQTMNKSLTRWIPELL